MTKSVLDVEEQYLTPGMKQYRKVKEQHPDCLVMLRMGDFYEMFYEDAITASHELDITLTARGTGEKRAPLAGVPFHAIEPYLGKLVKKGYKVAIVEQLEDPKKAQGLIKRGLVRIVTAGTLIETSLLSEKENNYLASIMFKEHHAAIAITDISTGECSIETTTSLDDLFSLLTRKQPSEIIISQSIGVNKELITLLKTHAAISFIDDQYYKYERARTKILDFFNIQSLDSFQLENDKLSTQAIGSLLHYIEETHKTKLVHIKKISRHNDHYLTLDQNTFRSLEITKSIKDGTRKGTLIEVLDYTKTPMGSRLLLHNLSFPLQNKMIIDARLDAVSDLKSSSLRLAQLEETLGIIQDIERLLAKIHTGIATPKDLLSLQNSLLPLPLLITKLSPQTLKSSLLQKISTLNTHKELVALLVSTIDEAAPHSTRDGNIFKSKHHKELDELRNIRDHSTDIITKIEESERKKTGISSLKIGFTRVFGYYLEITRKAAAEHPIPSYYIRKQTTANSERYITAELKDIEDKVLSADEKIKELEYQLFHELLDSIKTHTATLQDTAQQIAELDVYCSLTRAAITHHYTRPIITSSNSTNTLILKEVRHPVVETIIPQFISTSLELQPGEIMIITGPNMAGKSTIMRECALAILLAHIGSFVPATSASIPLTDKIFSRVGAYDDLSTGKSTFLVEMNETAHILHNATEKSFIILDEIGRGTSTFDGVSIAWSVTEYIYHHIKAKTLFATHYHILNNLAATLPRIKNYNVAVEESKEGITFLHTLVPGGTDQSYGIHVAKLAGIPKEILTRATEIQHTLEKDDHMVRVLKAKRLEDQKSITQF